MDDESISLREFARRNNLAWEREDTKMSDECSVSELGACSWCEKMQRERDEAVQHRDDYETRYIEALLAIRRLRREWGEARAAVALLRQTDLVETKMQRDEARAIARRLYTGRYLGIDLPLPEWLTEKEKP